MALYRCASGGGMKEKVLWTNSSPTTTFTAYEINLGESALNYDLLRIKFKSRSGSDPVGQDGEIIVPVSNLLTGGNSSYEIGYYLGGCNANNTIHYARRIYIGLNENLLTIERAAKVASSSGDTGSNNAGTGIPTEISGIKLS